MGGSLSISTRQTSGVDEIIDVVFSVQYSCESQIATCDDIRNLCSLYEVIDLTQMERKLRLK